MLRHGAQQVPARPRSAVVTPPALPRSGRDCSPAAGALCRDCGSPHCGANAASASTMTALTTTPRMHPKTAPRKRSNQRSPMPFTASAQAVPASPASSSTMKKNGKEPGDVRRPLGVDIMRVPCGRSRILPSRDQISYDYPDQRKELMEEPFRRPPARSKAQSPIQSTSRALTGPS